MKYKVCSPNLILSKESCWQIGHSKAWSYTTFRCGDLSQVSNIESDNSQYVGLEDYNNSRVSNIDSDNSQNVGLEDYNNISDGIFPNFTTSSLKISLG